MKERYQEFCRFLGGAPFLMKKMKTKMILVYLIILLIGLSVLKLFWSKYNALMNFRGGKMLKRNSVLGFTLLGIQIVVYLAFRASLDWIVFRLVHKQYWPEALSDFHFYFLHITLLLVSLLPICFTQDHFVACGAELKAVIERMSLHYIQPILGKEVRL